MIHNEDHRVDILEVVGAHPFNPSQRQMLHRADISVWLEEHMSDEVEIYGVVLAVDVRPNFPRVPPVPPLVSAKRHLSGAVYTQGNGCVPWLRRQGANSVRLALLCCWTSK